MFDIETWITGGVIGLLIAFGNSMLVLALKDWSERGTHALKEDKSLTYSIAAATIACTGVFTATCISRTIEELGKAEPSFHGNLLVIAVCALAGARYGSHAANKFAAEDETESHHDEELCGE